MKQNAQWLSQVRIRSKTAEETSTPSGSPALLVDPHDPGQRRAGAANEDAEVARVAEALEIDDVARLLPVNAEELVTHGQTGAGCRRRRGDRSHRGS